MSYRREAQQRSETWSSFQVYAAKAYSAVEGIFSHKQLQQGGCTFRASWIRADIRYIQRGCGSASDLILLLIWTWQKLIILSFLKFSGNCAAWESPLTFNDLWSKIYGKAEIYALLLFCATALILLIFPTFHIILVLTKGVEFSQQTLWNTGKFPQKPEHVLSHSTI